MELSGPIGTTGAKWDVSVDAQLNVVLAVKAPLALMLSALTAKSTNPVVGDVVTLLEQAAEAVVVAKDAAAAAAAAPAAAK